MTAAAGTAAAGGQIIFGGNSPQFQRLGDVSVNGLLQLVKLILSLNETTSDRIREERVAIRFECSNLLPGQWKGALLFLLQFAALGHDGVILLLHGVIGEKGVNPLPNLLHPRCFENGLAKFACFFGDGRFFG